LQRLHAAMTELEGPNDGLVSVESALAFGTPLPHWPVDHLRQTNWMVPDPVAEGAPSAVEFYAEAIANLARLGFAADDGAKAGGPLPIPAPPFTATPTSTSTPGDPGVLQLQG
jgi:triacylglycerol lipase